MEREKGRSKYFFLQVHDGKVPLYVEFAVKLHGYQVVRGKTGHDGGMVEWWRGRAGRAWEALVAARSSVTSPSSRDEVQPGKNCRHT